MAITLKIRGRRGTITSKTCGRAVRVLMYFRAAAENPGWGSTDARLPPRVNALSESNNPQLMGLECSDTHRGGGRHSLRMQRRLPGSIVAHRRHQLTQTHPFQGKPTSRQGRALHLPLGLPVPSRLPKTVKETAASPPFPAEAVARQTADSCPHLEQLVSPCVSILVTCNNVWEDGLGGAPPTDSSWS